jgi:hypothetical protein
MQQQLTTLNVSSQSKELLARSSLTALDLMCDPTQAHRLQVGVKNFASSSELFPSNASGGWVPSGQ